MISLVTLYWWVIVPILLVVGIIEIFSENEVKPDKRSKDEIKDELREQGLIE